MDDEDGRARSTRALATALFPDEQWVHTERRIWVAQSRMSEQRQEKNKWDKEMSQARILTSRGSIAYFLPERQMGQNERRCATTSVWTEFC